MKKLFFILVFLCSLSAVQPLLAQETYNVKFDYDDAGNRFMRWIEISRLKETDSIPSELAMPKSEEFSQTLVYPNPTLGSLTIDMKIDNEHPVNYLLADTEGKTLAKGPVIDNKTSLHLESFKPGIYFLQLNNDKGSAIFKIVKH